MVVAAAAPCGGTPRRRRWRSRGGPRLLLYSRQRESDTWRQRRLRWRGHRRKPLGCERGRPLTGRLWVGLRGPPLLNGVLGSGHHSPLPLLPLLPLLPFNGLCVLPSYRLGVLRDTGAQPSALLHAHGRRRCADGPAGPFGRCPRRVLPRKARRIGWGSGPGRARRGAASRRGCPFAGVGLGGCRGSEETLGVWPSRGRRSRAALPSLDNGGATGGVEESAVLLAERALQLRQRRRSRFTLRLGSNTRRCPAAVEGVQQARRPCPSHPERELLLLLLLRRIRIRHLILPEGGHRDQRGLFPRVRRR